MKRYAAEPPDLTRMALIMTDDLTVTVTDDAGTEVTTLNAFAAACFWWGAFASVAAVFLLWGALTLAQMAWLA